ncbi:Acyl-coenzyme A:6-aminopenicillanic-acid-acyltransferase 29 kDa subunit [Hyphodiscus hymeniophilus]|uniref:Acyl-coenzyme A:6-aminopenicillanic-acid-acyltransferase 29 kDa subunit n=1 Tax=Hyphodiscus hymeniophilus TaxID=353542 RepID=A0A9P6SQJ1_9HELO|nr:Acyl-coenzyme A:6-aminopenicillanic-acid-acyltransferase 29 kDa subunit [Hyphodiscus hymeniophilus]
MVKTIECAGTPYQIGFTHGSEAAGEIVGSIAFYTDLFMKYSKKTWPEVQEVARSFDLEIRAKWPRYHAELQGIADGSKHDILDIVAINVRTEIAFGLFSDGCTSLFWETPEHVFLGQNWDWMEEQKANIIVLTIKQESFPAIKMVTEGGIIGKIGINSAGVGVCLNAIRTKGLDVSRMPVHLGLRSVLESSSAKEAVAKLEGVGMAASAHMLIGDASGEAVGLEFTKSTFAKLKKDDLGTIVHSNHLLVDHAGLKDPAWMKDSLERFQRMTALTQKYVGKGPSLEEFSALFQDESGYPGAICRAQVAPSTSATLFNIVMDLKSKTAIVKLGRPTAVEETIFMRF